MQTLKRHFDAKNYEAVKTEIYQDPEYKTNLLKLRYLASAYYYSRDFQGTLTVIEILKALDLKTAYSMLINTHITLGTDEEAALDSIDRYLNEAITETERSWVYFQKGLCYLARDNKSEGVKFLNAAKQLENAAMDLERHFFLNNALDNYHDAGSDNEKINLQIIQARLERNEELAREARSKAIVANYGEAEYFATAVLAKYLDINEEKLALKNRFGVDNKVIYYRII